MLIVTSPPRWTAAVLTMVGKTNLSAGIHNDVWFLYI